MSFTIFYSWQDDRPRKHHHYLIRDALCDAITRIAESESLILDESPRSDHDTKDVSGTPEIAATIFGKIDQCALFVADLTFVGSTNHPGVSVLEPLPNPYEMAEDSNEFRQVQTGLAGHLLVAVRSALVNEHEEVNRIVRLLDISCLKLIGKHGRASSFSAPTGFALGVPANELDTPSFHRAVERLLDLGVLRADVNPSEGLYVYHWTYLGTLVCKKLRIGVERL